MNILVISLKIDGFAIEKEVRLKNRGKDLKLIENIVWKKVL